VLIGLIALTIGLFGVEATDGPLQVALLLAAAFASLIAFKNGHTVAAVAEAAIGGVTSALGARCRGTPARPTSLVSSVSPLPPTCRSASSTF
jgi:hypothetical protein